MYPALLKSDIASCPSQLLDIVLLGIVRDIVPLFISFREEGFEFEDKKFLCVRADKNSIYAKDDRRGLVLGMLPTVKPVYQ